MYYPGRLYSITVDCSANPTVSACGFLLDVETAGSAGLASNQVGSFSNTGDGSWHTVFGGYPYPYTAVTNTNSLAKVYTVYWVAPPALTYANLTVRATVVLSYSSTNCSAYYKSVPLATLVKCGDGVKDALEPCDDGNLIGGDGCSGNCTIETGYTCNQTYVYPGGSPHNYISYSPPLGERSLCTQCRLVVTPVNATAYVGTSPSYTLQLSTFLAAGANAFVTLVLLLDPAFLSRGGLVEASLSATAVTFDSTNWNKPVTITTAIAASDGILGARVHSVQHGLASSDPNFAGLAAGSVLLPAYKLSVLDARTAGVLASATAVTVSKGSVTGANYTLTLGSQPVVLVTVTPTPANPLKVATVPPAIVFTAVNWNVPQQVRVLGVDNHVVDGTVAVALAHVVSAVGDTNYNGLAANVAGLAVTVLDTDVAGIVFSTFVLNVTMTFQVATYTISLLTAPAANVTVTLTPSTNLAAPASVILNAANWQAGVTVNFTAPNTFLANGNQAASMCVCGNGACGRVGSSGVLTRDRLGSLALLYFERRRACS